MPSITLNNTTERELLRAAAQCRCMYGRRRIPIRMTRGLVGLARHVDPRQLLLTYMCSDCKQIIQIRAGDVTGVAAASA